MAVSKDNMRQIFNLAREKMTKEEFGAFLDDIEAMLDDSDTENEGTETTAKVEVNPHGGL